MRAFSELPVFSARGPHAGPLTRLEELKLALRALSIHGAHQALLRWTARHHGQPRSLGADQLAAIRSDLGAVQLSLEESDLTRIIALIRGRAS